MAQINILEARVKFPADKVWQSKQEGGKDYVSLKCELTNGTGDAVAYANVGSPEQSLLASYRKGDPVQLAYDGKKYSVVGSGGDMKMATESIPNAAKNPQREPAEPKKLDADQAKDYTLIYASVFILLSEKLPITTPPEVLQDAASTVFIALTRN